MSSRLVKKLLSSIESRDAEETAGAQGDGKLIERKKRKQKQKQKRLNERKEALSKLSKEDLIQKKVNSLLAFDGRFEMYASGIALAPTKKKKVSNKVIVGNSRSSASQMKPVRHRTATKGTKARILKNKKAKSVKDLAKMLKKEFGK